MISLSENLVSLYFKAATVTFIGEIDNLADFYLWIKSAYLLVSFIKALSNSK